MHIVQTNKEPTALRFPSALTKANAQDFLCINAWNLKRASLFMTEANQLFLIQLPVVEKTK